MYLYTSLVLYTCRWALNWRELTMHLAGYASRYINKKQLNRFSVFFTGSQTIYGPYIGLKPYMGQLVSRVPVYRYKEVLFFF